MTIQRNLFALKTFLDRNPQLFSSAPGEQVGSRQSAEHDPWKVSVCTNFVIIEEVETLKQAEHTSSQQLQALLSRTIEAISFVLLLIDYNFGELVSQ